MSRISPVSGQPVVPGVAAPPSARACGAAVTEVVDYLDETGQSLTTTNDAAVPEIVGRRSHPGGVIGRSSGAASWWRRRRT